MNRTATVRSNYTPYEKKGAQWKAITDAVVLYIEGEPVNLHSIVERGFGSLTFGGKLKQNEV